MLTLDDSELTISVSKHNYVYPLNLLQSAGAARQEGQWGMCKLRLYPLKVLSVLMHMHGN